MSLFELSVVSFINLHKVRVVYTKNTVSKNRSVVKVQTLMFEYHLFTLIFSSVHKNLYSFFLSFFSFFYFLVFFPLFSFSLFLLFIFFSFPMFPFSALFNCFSFISFYFFQVSFFVIHLNFLPFLNDVFSFLPLLYSTSIYLYKS